MSGGDGSEALRGDNPIEESAFEADPAAVYAFIATFLEVLRQSGVEHVVLSPGSRSTPLAIVAEKLDGLRVWIELDERAAAFFALGLAKDLHIESKVAWLTEK